VVALIAVGCSARNAVDTAKDGQATGASERADGESSAAAGDPTTRAGEPAGDKPGVGLSIKIGGEGRHPVGQPVVIAVDAQADPSFDHLLDPGQGDRPEIEIQVAGSSDEGSLQVASGAVQAGTSAGGEGVAYRRDLELHIDPGTVDRPTSGVVSVVFGATDTSGQALFVRRDVSVVADDQDIWVGTVSLDNLARERLDALFAEGRIDRDRYDQLRTEGLETGVMAPGDGG
jgi:hypothetical protein